MQRICFLHSELSILYPAVLLHTNKDMQPCTYIDMSDTLHTETWVVAPSRYMAPIIHQDAGIDSDDVWVVPTLGHSHIFRSLLKSG